MAQAAVQTYVTWLYTGKVLVNKEEDQADGDSFNVQLLKAWQASHVFKDYNFKNAIIAEYVSSIESGMDSLSHDCVEYAYDEDAPSSM